MLESVEVVPAEVAERLYQACKFVRAWIAMNIDQMDGIPDRLQAHVTLVEAMDAADRETP
jgi:antirestriction protein ArdC